MITEAFQSYSNIFLHTEGYQNDTNFLALKAALARLEANGLSGLLWQINSATKPIYITMDASIEALANRGSLTAIIGTNNDNKPSYVDSGHFIFMSPDDLTGVEVHGFDTDFNASFDRLLFHELFHVYDNLPQLSDGGLVTRQDWNSNAFEIDFAEEIAVFAENFIYAGTAGQLKGDTHVRLGHLTAPTKFGEIDFYGEGGASGVSGFSGYPMYQSYSDQGDSFTFTAQELGGHFNSKTYYKPGYDLFGNGSLLTKYDHYIRYETGGGYIAFGNPESVTVPTHVTAVLPDVMFDDVSNAFEGVARVFASVNHLFDGFQSAAGSGAMYMRTYAQTLGVMGVAGAATYPDMMVTRLVGIGADRWGDGVKDEARYIDLSGPVQHGATYPTGPGFLDVGGAPTTISAPRLGINDQHSTVGAVLAGASGFVLDDSVIASPYLDATGSSDWIVAGSGSDVIIMGTGGQDAGNANYAYGNDGNDMLFGRQGIDNLFGGAGNDIFSPGAGADYIVGGSGLDTLDYHESASGVWLNLVTQVGLLGDAEGDAWRGIEKFIGSSHDDTFIGNGGAFMAGMEGNDTFHLKNGDVAYGGEGADKFYIEIMPGQPASIGIVDLDPSDSIYINGSRFQGYGTYVNGVSYNPSMTGQVWYNGDLPGYPMMPETMAKISFIGMPSPWGPPPSSGSPALDIYIAGYTSGDGGISMTPSYANINFPFYPDELL